MDRAVERVSPKAVRDAVRAFRFANEGVTDNTGKIIMTPTNLDPLEIFWQSLGFSPAQVAEMYSRNRAVKDRTTGEYSRAIKELRKYNAQFPENPITLDEVIKSVEQRNKDEQIVQQFGATLGKRELAYARKGNPYNVR